MGPRLESYACKVWWQTAIARVRQQQGEETWQPGCACDSPLGLRCRGTAPAAFHAITQRSMHSSNHRPSIKYAPGRIQQHGRCSMHSMHSMHSSAPRPGSSSAPRTRCSQAPCCRRPPLCSSPSGSLAQRWCRGEPPCAAQREHGADPAAPRKPRPAVLHWRPVCAGPGRCLLPLPLACSQPSNNQLLMRLSSPAVLPPESRAHAAF